jgi:hypothetical protein
LSLSASTRSKPSLFLCVFFFIFLSSII